MKPVSLWVVTDLSTPSGRQMILNVLKFMVNNPLIILFIYNYYHFYHFYYYYLLLLFICLLGDQRYSSCVYY